MSIYSVKQNANGVQTWVCALTLFPGGGDASVLFGLYKSLGDMTYTGNNALATLLDGPEKVVRYGNLTLGDGVTATSLTASQRCKGLTILCDSLTVKANATLNMTGKGPRIVTNDDPFFPFVDFRIPGKITLDSAQIPQAQAQAAIKAQGMAVWDSGFWQSIMAQMYGFNLGVSLPGSVALLSAAGCAAGAPAQSVNQSYVNGSIGAAGAGGGTGSGGHGGLQARIDASGYYAAHNKSGAGNPYGGGNATSGLGAGNGYGNVTDDVVFPVPYAFKVCSAVGSGGGGAGIGAAAAATCPWGGSASAGGEGVGGKLVVICRGTVSVLSGGKIEANGMPGGSASGATYGVGGGGSGGGDITLITPSPAQLANSGTIQAAGGAGGGGPYGAGGSGGAGSVVTKDFSGMGW